MIFWRRRNQVPERFRFYWDEENLKQLLLFPLVFQQETSGVFVVFSQTKRLFTKSFVILMQIFAHILAQAFRRHQDWQMFLLTQKRDMEQKLLMEKVEDMVNFGQMMSAVTHEIRQPLQSIRILSESPLYWAK